MKLPREQFMAAVTTFKTVHGVEKFLELMVEYRLHLEDATSDRVGIAKFLNKFAKTFHSSRQSEEILVEVCLSLMSLMSLMLFVMSLMHNVTHSH